MNGILIWSTIYFTLGLIIHSMKTEVIGMDLFIEPPRIFIFIWSVWIIYLLLIWVLKRKSNNRSEL